MPSQEVGREAAASGGTGNLDQRGASARAAILGSPLGKLTSYPAASRGRLHARGSVVYTLKTSRIPATKPSVLVLKKSVKFTPGYYALWSGQFEYFERRAVADVVAGFNLSVAVVVAFIALVDLGLGSCFLSLWTPLAFERIAQRWFLLAQFPLFLVDTHRHFSGGVCCLAAHRGPRRRAPVLRCDWLVPLGLPGSRSLELPLPRGTTAPNFITRCNITGPSV